MSTVTSPRPSAASSRTSLDVPAPGSTTGSLSGSTRAPTSNRRNRAALRDYYNLGAAEQSGARSPGLPPASPRPQDYEEDSPGGLVEHAELAALDREGFDAEGYVRGVLEREGLEGVLRVEGSLVSEIRGLDGERKALVYDNYSKLIAATDTIRKMRTNMDPLTPTTSTLSPAISHIAETASSLSAALAQTSASARAAAGPPRSTTGTDAKTAQIRTVRWVLAAPERLRTLVASGDVAKAREDWSEVRRLLERWDGVQGAEDARRKCEDALAPVGP